MQRKVMKNLLQKGLDDLNDTSQAESARSQERAGSSNERGHNPYFSEYSTRDKVTLPGANGAANGLAVGESFFKTK